MLGFLYLYRQYDSDLILLLNNVGEKSFRNILKDSLRKLIRPYYIPKVDISNLYISNNIEIKEPKSIVTYSIASKKDSDIFELLKSVRNGQKNNFVKMAMRYHLGVTYVMSAMLNINNPLKSVPIYIPSSSLIQITNQNIKEETSQLNEEKEINNSSDVLLQDNNKNEDIIKQSEDKNILNKDVSNNYNDTSFDLDNDNELEDFDALSILERMMG